ncbi:hypothetical protein WJX74_005302 [Apatococcus lobatus]|uniref:Uncharacterized protein n=1 Tax=Apatococcus lobatus TaxID=904363 RepID=A0AAW1QYR9_9CHLO
MASLTLYSTLQERLMATPFDGAYFKYPVLLVLANRVVSCTTAALRLKGREESLYPNVPLQKFIIVAGSNILATTCQYEALRHISLPWQALCKAGKLIPVMLWGILINHKHYSGTEWVTAAAVTGGCSLFLAGGSSLAAAAGRHSSAYGLTLMVGYLACDSFTSSFQDKLFRSHRMSSLTQALYVNLCSSVISTAGLASSGQVRPALSFMHQHPIAVWYMLCLSAASTCGQFCIVETIKSHGALYLALIMTLRQFVSISASAWLFGHRLTAAQWVGIVLTFGSLLWRSSRKRRPSQAQRRE